MIEVQDLNYRYPKAAEAAVRGLNFKVQAGEVFGFLGPSGAGKSTTQKVLTGLLRGFHGQVSVFGKCLSNWKGDLYEKIGISFESPNHFLKLTALENLMYFSRLFTQKTIDPLVMLARVGLEQDARLPVEQYSKGMKNRLTLARALLHNPQLLFLDEPTSGLDPVNALMVKELIREQQNQGKTVFLTTHNMTVAEELCDRVAFIVDGEIVLINSPKNLKLEYGRPTVIVEAVVAGSMTKHEFSLPNLGENEDFLNLIRTHTVQTIHTQEASLEDIFIKVTGRRLV